MIPPALLDDVEQAFLRVLRCRHPDALFIVRDLGDGERPVREDDSDVSGQVAGGAAGDFHPVDEAGENGSALESVEASPQSRKRSAGRKSRGAGG
jgi:hypothetical protein